MIECFQSHFFNKKPKYRQTRQASNLTHLIRVSILWSIMALKAKIFLFSLLIQQSFGYDCEKASEGLIFDAEYNSADAPESPDSEEFPIDIRMKFKSIEEVDDSMKTLTFSARINVHWIGQISH